MNRRFAILLRLVADDHKTLEKKSEHCIEEAFTLMRLVNVNQVLEESEI